MRRLGRFEPEPGPLVHAEAVLLVDDHEAQAMEDHAFLYNGMGTYEYVDASVPQSPVYLPAFLGLCAASQQGDPDTRTGQTALEVAPVLHRQHLGRGHDAGLVAVVHCNEGREHGHHRLAAAYVPLQEAVHLLSGHGIAAYFLDDSFLSSRQLIGQVAVAPVECLSDFSEKYAGRAAHPYVLLPQQGQLQEKEAEIQDLRKWKREHMARNVKAVQGSGVISGKGAKSVTKKTSKTSKKIAVKADTVADVSVEKAMK